MWFSILMSRAAGLTNRDYSADRRSGCQAIDFAVDRERRVPGDVFPGGCKDRFPVTAVVLRSMS